MVAVAVRRVDLAPDRYLIYIDPQEEPLGDMLIRLRGERGWSQTDLARAIARPGEKIASLASLINKYESGGISNPDDDMIGRLATALDVSWHTIDYAAHVAAKRRRRKPIPPNSFVIGPVTPELREVLEALKRAEDERFSDIAQAVRIVVEGSTPPEKRDEEPAG